MQLLENRRLLKLMKVRRPSPMLFESTTNAGYNMHVWPVRYTKARITCNQSKTPEQKG